METPIIDCHNLSKKYSSGTLALKNINIKINSDGIVGLIGRNGAGKTSLIKLLLGFTLPTQGHVQIFGDKPSNCYKRLGFVPEQPSYHLKWSPNKLLSYVAAIRGISSKQRKGVCEKILSDVGLTKVADKHLWQFSKGMLQRFSIAQNLIHDPDLLIMDEPMSGLDPEGQKQFRDLLLSIKRQGRTVLISSHQLYHLEKICDNVILIDAGTVKYEGKPAIKSGNAIFRLVEPLPEKHFVNLQLHEPVSISPSEFSLKSPSEHAVQETISYLVQNRINIHSLTRESTSLEQLFIEVVGGGK